MPMGGWVTWLAVLGFVALGVVDIVNGDVDAAMVKFTAALAALGLGRKVEKKQK
jgi:hypothetical protein